MGSMLSGYGKYALGVWEVFRLELGHSGKYVFFSNICIQFSPYVNVYIFMKNNSFCVFFSGV